jgi:Septum formation
MSILRGHARHQGRPLRVYVLYVLGVVMLLAASCTGSGDTATPSAPSTSAGVAGPASGRPPPTASATPSATPTPSPDPPPNEDVCRRVTIKELRTIVNEEPPVRCRSEHTVVTYHVGRLPREVAATATSPGQERVENAADRVCRKRFRGYVGGGFGDRRTSMLTPTYFLPSTEQFELGARWLRCDVYAYAKPSRLADLPRSLEDAMERDVVSANFGRCSPVSPSHPKFRHIVCRRPHHWRAVALQNLGTANEAYPGSGTVQERARNRCEARVRDYIGTEEAFSYGFEVPRRKAWEQGDRNGLCWARTDL